MPKLTINLTSAQSQFVDAHVKAGHLGSASEYIAMLVQIQQLRKHRGEIEALLLEGIKSGPSTPMTTKDWRAIEREGMALVRADKTHASTNKKATRRPRRPA